VLYLVSEPVAALRLEDLNPSARSLDEFYAPDKDRRETYEQIVSAIVDEVSTGKGVCAVLYGHPGVFAYPGHEAIRRVRAAGLPARMHPAISSLDCLFADLGLDPGQTGFQCYEATDFLLRSPPVDPAAALFLLQVGMLGETGGAPSGRVEELIETLFERLRSLYGADREAALYEASAYPGSPPLIERFRLGDPPQAPSLMATLVVEPVSRP
jgi:uroporphyrin-III C-methyltransferase